jgi:hypothetical protein
MSEAIKVILKSKSISVVVDFCIEEKIEFSVRPQAFPDTDWEFNILVKDIKTAVLTGMFLRDNRIDIMGNEQQQQKLKKAPVVKKKEEEKQVAEEIKDNETGDKGLF